MKTTEVLMFYVGECVRSEIYGLGQVLLAGEEPTVRLIDGAELVVTEGALTVVPREVYYDAVENRRQIERWLDIRIYGHATADNPWLPPPPVDLAREMENQAFQIGTRETEPLGASILYFDAAEPAERPSQESDQAPTESNVVRVTATRVTHG